MKRQTLFTFFTTFVVFFFALPASLYATFESTGDQITILPQKDTCIVTGCSGQLCVSSKEDPLYTTCEWKDEYACLNKARCEVQANGTCGWTHTSEYNECLNPPQIAHTPTPTLSLCGNGVCDLGEADSTTNGGCAIGSTPECIGPPAQLIPGTCPRDCAVPTVLLLPTITPKPQPTTTKKKILFPSLTPEPTLSPEKREEAPLESNEQFSTQIPDLHNNNTKTHQDKITQSEILTFSSPTLIFLPPVHESSSFTSELHTTKNLFNLDLRLRTFYEKYNFITFSF